MDIRDIQIVMAVAAAKSYNKAADMLGVTHQSVSKAMGRINRQVRKPLFRREGTRLAATDFGLEFLRDAAGLEQAFAEFERRYAALPHRVAGDGELSVALVTGGKAGLPEGFFEAYTVAHPGVALVIEEMNSDRVLSAVKAGEFDVGVLGTHPSLLTGFESKAIVRMGVWLAVPEGHPLAKTSLERGARHVGLGALDGLPMVTAGATNHLPRFVMGECRRAGVTPNVVATATDGEFMKSLSRQRGAVCFAFDPRIRKPPEGCVAVRVDFPGSEEFGTYAVRRAGAAHTLAAQVFWDEQLPMIGE